MIRLCIIGCGAVVEGSHARVLPFLSESLRVTACYDIDVARAARMAAILGAPRAATPDAIDGDQDLWDAALIATPPALHAPLARALLAAGRHVLVEKPFTTRESDARELIALGEQTGARVLVGHFRRYYPSVQAARAAVANDAIGRVERIEVWEGSRWDWPARSSYAFTSPDGGVTLDTGSHALDTLLYTLGIDAAEDVTLEVGDWEKTPEREPSQDVSIRGMLRGGSLPPTPILVRLSRLGPLATALKVHGENGRSLVVPAGYAEAATLVEEGAVRRVEPPADAKYHPPEPTSAFYCEYLDLIASIGDATYKSAIDGHRFLGLTRALESITALSRAT